MGTRNLTMVIKNRQTKVAQYGQWDGYPSGQGITALKFCRDNYLEDFKGKLDKVRFNNDEDDKKENEFLKSIGVTGDWLNIDQSRLWKEKYPLYSRDLGAEILQLIFDSKEDEIVVRDSESFAADSLFCEWAYVIDFDKNVFEVYEGFNTAPLPEGNRFKDIKKEGEYYPVKLVQSFPLDKLPTEEEFLAILEAEEQEEED